MMMRDLAYLKLLAKEYPTGKDVYKRQTYNLFRTLSDSGLGAFTVGAENTQALG